MRHRIIRIHLALCLSMLVVLVGPASPSLADAPGSGTLEFSLIANLPTFPCAPPGCDGTFNGTSGGQLAGVDAGTIPWTATWIPGAVGMASGSFHYVDDCSFPVGIASGSGTLTQQVPFTAGTYGPVSGATTPYPVVQVDSTFSFVWTRIGVNALVTTTISVTIKIARPGGVFQSLTVVDGHRGVAIAAFAPTSGSVPDCSTPGGLVATVAAVDVVAN